MTGVQTCALPIFDTDARTIPTEIGLFGRAVARLLDAPGEIALLYDVNWRKLWTKRFRRKKKFSKSVRLVVPDFFLSMVFTLVFLCDKIIMKNDNIFIENI